jgi:hypothetical protein
MKDNSNQNPNPQRFSEEKVIYMPGVKPQDDPQPTEPQAVRFRSDPQIRNRNPQAAPDQQLSEATAIRALRKAGYSDSEILRIIESKRKTKTNQPAVNPQPQQQTADPQRPQAAEPQPDPQYVPPVIAAPPGAGFDNLKRWGGLAVSPVKWLLSEPEGAAPAQVADTEPLPNWLWFTLLLFGIATFLWDVNLSQAVMIHIFPAFAESQKQTDNLFANGLTFNVRAGLSGGLISIGSSMAQFIFLRKLKLGQRVGRLQYTILFLAIAQNFVFSVVGYTDFFRHEDYFEWNPAATQIWPRPGSKPHMEWGSIIIMIGALLTAILPELCFSELPRGSKAKGHYVQTKQGLKWVEGGTAKGGQRR